MTIIVGCLAFVIGLLAGWVLALLCAAAAEQDR